MELRHHFEFYRRGIKPDLLEGVVEFTKQLPTKQPGRFPTAYDLLNYCVSEIQRHVQFNDIYNYKKILQTHQKLLIAALERHVDRFLNDFVNIYGLSNDLIKDFITEKGWRWFKFCKYSYIHNEKFRVLPRYYDGSMNTNEDYDRDSHLLILDTEELLLCASHKSNPMNIKPNGEKLIGFQDNEAMSIPIEALNANWAVHDWTAPLFPGGSNEVGK